MLRSAFLPLAIMVMLLLPLQASAENAPALVDSFGTFGSATGQFYYANGLAFSAQSNLLYVADSGNHRLQVFSPNGEFVAEMRNLQNVESVAIDQGSGIIYVAFIDEYPFDDGSRIMKLSSDRSLITSWNRAGDRHLGRITGLALDREGNVLATEVGGYPAWTSVLKFTAAGDFIGSFGGSDDGSRFEDICVDESGDIYVGDVGDYNRVLKYRDNGNLVETLNMGYEEPRSLATGPGGCVYVCSVHKIHKFIGGAEVSSWGELPMGGSYWGICVDDTGKDIYVVYLFNNWYEDNKILKYSYSPTPVERASWGRLKRKF